MLTQRSLSATAFPAEPRRLLGVVVGFCSGSPTTTSATPA